MSQFLLDDSTICLMNHLLHLPINIRKCSTARNSIAPRNLVTNSIAFSDTLPLSVVSHHCFYVPLTHVACNCRVIRSSCWLHFYLLICRQRLSVAGWLRHQTIERQRIASWFNNKYHMDWLLRTSLHIAGLLNPVVGAVGDEGGRRSRDCSVNRKWKRTFLESKTSTHLWVAMKRHFLRYPLHAAWLCYEDNGGFQYFVFRTSIHSVSTLGISSNSIAILLCRCVGNLHSPCHPHT